MKNNMSNKCKETLKGESKKDNTVLSENAAIKAGESVAVIGMACRYPGGANTPEKFWKMLADGTDAVTEIPSDRWDADQYYDADADAPGKMYTRYGAFLEEPNHFDASFFEISPKEVEVTDPQQRLLLEVSYEALESAGLELSKLRGSNTGVFVGISTLDYASLHIFSGSVKDINAYSLYGFLHSAACGRLSYFYDFNGPSMVLDTACSSSLMALHEAIKHLEHGDTDLALAGGVSLNLVPETFLALSKLKVLSASGSTRTFDNSADGYVRGEGCGVVVLKRLKDARRAGDRILAVLRGSAVNHDGRTRGATVPNGLAQENLITAALENAGVSPGDIDYVEAHGTGTKVGDRTEILALGSTFKSRKNKLWVGSVKSNIGHLEAGAGISAVIKVILSLQHNIIPPTVHFRNYSSVVRWDDVPIEVVARPTPWPKGMDTRLAGVSSFGISGTNVHVIIGDAPAIEPGKPDAAGIERIGSGDRQRPYHMLTFSARQEETLNRLAAKYKEYLEQTKFSTADICYTSNISRTSFEHRLALVGASKEDFIKKLSRCLENSERLAAVTAGDKKPANNKIVFMYTGQDSQYVGMGRRLYETNPVFRAEIDTCDTLFRPLTGSSIIELLYSDDAEDTVISQALHAQPVIFSVEYALTKLWESWGIVPSAVVGHSIGEYAAACTANVFTLEEAVKLVAIRGKLMHTVPGNGKMAGILTGEEQVKTLLSSVTGSVSIAAVNAKENVTISGENSAVDDVLRKTKELGIFVENLNISHPFHSELMTPYVKQLQKEIADISFSTPCLQFVSGKTGRWASEAELCSVDYWARHIAESVRFYDAMKTLENDGYQIFIEIGGTAALAGLAGQCIENEDALFIPSMRKGRNSWQMLLTGLSRLYLRGVDMDWDAFHRHEGHSRAVLPSYPFDRKQYWASPTREPKPSSGSLKSSWESKKQLDYPENHRATGHVSDGFIPKKDLPVEEKGHRRIKAVDIASQLNEIIYAVSGIEATAADANKDLFALGMDSLTLVQARTRIRKQYGVDISLNKFFMELTTLNKIDAFIREQLPEQVLKEHEERLPGVDGTSSPPARANEPDMDAETERIMNRRLEPGEKGMTQSFEALEFSKPLVGSPEKVKPPASKSTVDFRSMKFEPDPLTPVQQEFLGRFIQRYTERTKGSKAFAAAKPGVLSDWINSMNFRLSLKELIYPIVTERSGGAKLWDIDGNEYIDLAIGLGVNYFGHGPAFITEAIKKQADEGFELGAQSKLAGEVATLISELTGAERISFSNSGTEAVMASLRIARAVTGRRLVVRFAGSYDGTFDGVLTEADEQGPYPISPGTPPGMVADMETLSYGAPRSLETIKQLGGRVAAVLVEPVHSRRPGFQPKEFLKQLRRLASDIGAALIFDETFLGFRIHPGGAQAYFGIEADIVTYGKIVGGGLPIGIVAGKRRYMDAIDGGSREFGNASMPGKTIFFGGNFCRHPLALAAARAVLREMKKQGPALQEDVNQRTRRLAEAANRFFKEERVPIVVTYFGSQMRFESFGKYDLSLKPIEMDLFFYLLTEKGIYTWERRICWLCTAHDEQHMEEILKAIKESIFELRSGGFDFDCAVSMPPEEGKSTPGSADSTFPMSSAQKRVYALCDLPGGEHAYHVTMAIIINGPLDKKKFEDIFRLQIVRHESLRTSFSREGEEFVQKVHDYEDIDFSIRESNGAVEKIDTLVDEFIRPFDLSVAPLLRVSLVQLGTEKELESGIEPGTQSHLFMIDAHHIVTDGLSMSIFSRDHMELYAGTDPAPVTMQYRDYVEHEQEYFRSDDFETDENFWLDKLSGQLPVLDLPTDFARPKKQSFSGKTLRARLGREQTVQLDESSREAAVSLNMVLLTAYYILLARISGREDILVGTPIAIRDYGDFENSIGMFTNTAVLRGRPQGNKPLSEFLHEVKEDCLAAFAHHEYPLERLVDKLDFKRDISRNPIFDAMFVYENANDRVFKMEGLVCEDYPFEVGFAQVDLTLQVIEEEGELKFSLFYSDRLFKAEIVEYWSAYYQRILKQIADRGNPILGDIELLGDEEKYRLLVEFNDTKADYPKEKTIHQLFKEQAERTPDRVSIVGSQSILSTPSTPSTKSTLSTQSIQLTYNELDEKSSQMARLLHKKGVKAGDIVGIMAGRSIQTIIGIMGILKAGGAYLPIDPNYPEVRKQFMLKDSDTGILLSDSSAPGISVGLNGKIEIIHLNEWDEEVGESSILNVGKGESNSRQSSSSLAYIIYTSGTTGKPKGNLTSHRNVVNVSLAPNYVDIRKKDRILQLSNYAFDGSVFDIFGALLNGAVLVMMPPGQGALLGNLVKSIIDEKITVFFLTTALFNTLVDLEIQCLGNTRKILFGGERVSLKHARKALRYLGKNRIINVYGPTEATVFTTYYSINEIAENAVTIPIGRQIANDTAYIVDKTGGLVPIGVPGELLVGGDGVARGYLNRPELTSERFVLARNLRLTADSFPNTRDSLTHNYFYKTGDLVKWLPCGNIEFLGRIDQQVKVRGFRIELGEIENRLLSNENITEAIVVAKQDKENNNYLVAFFVPNDAGTHKTQDAIPVSQLRNFLSKELPDYMIPAYFVPLEKFPLTPNGKIDRKVLLETHDTVGVPSEYQPPTNEIEKKLVDIWKEVLGMKQIGIATNFFEVGGHSLKAINIIAKIKKIFQVDISLSVLFENPFVKEQACYISNSVTSIFTAVRTVEKKDYYPVSSAQKRMYTLNRFATESVNYNMGGALLIEGSLSTARFEEAFQKLITRHESLRTSFHFIDGEPVQRIHDKVEFRVKSSVGANCYPFCTGHKGSGSGESCVPPSTVRPTVASFLRPFELSRAPLLRAELVKQDENKTIFLLDMHHIISDGVSIDIFVTEFSGLYAGLELEPLKVQYKDYAAWQNRSLESEELSEQKKYWQERFAGEVPVLEMPTDYPRPKIQRFEGETIAFEIPEELTAQLRRMTEKHGATLYMTLLALFNILLSKYSRQEDLIIGSPSAGRRHTDLENIIGMFVNTLSMRNFPGSNKTFEDFLTEVKQNCLEAFENQDYQFDDLLEHLDLKRDLGRNPLFDAMFILQNPDNEELKIKGLTFSPCDVENNIAKFDITMLVTEKESKLLAHLEYCLGLFKKETMLRFISHFENILEEVVSNPTLTLAQINMLSEAEEKQLLYEFNGTEADYPKNKTIHKLFEEQVERTPDLISIVGSTQYAVGNEKIKEKIKSKKEIKNNKKIKEQK
ncbi:MAG: amino acid adenylation domain-containing protein, partial [bacterium]|nr:amino acid adenylation domain-containing protein [bacterium]